MLAQGSNANSRHAGGWTALHAAAVSGNLGACKLLLENGAKPDLVDAYEAANTPLMVQRSWEFSRELRPQASSDGMTALHYAALMGFGEIVDALLAHGADPTIKTLSGHTAADTTDQPMLEQKLRDAEKKWMATREEEARAKRNADPLHLQLKQHIVGQDAPIDAVSAAVCRRQNGWHDENRPMVFLFLGSSGIGKTELAKRLAEFLHGDKPQAFVRFDMSEYQQKHEVAKFIGSPPGYVGHDDGGQLVNKLRTCPNAVVLLDEVEKAHPDVLTVLLQLFDEGRLTDGKGDTVECKDAIFVMTSNLAQDQIAEFATEYRDEHGPDASVYATKQFKESVIRPILKGHFQRDEFLGRIHEVLYFWPFSAQQLHQLVRKELEKWALRAKERHNIELTWDDRVVQVLAGHYNVHYGARSLQHAVNRIVINKLAKAHEESRLKRNDRVRVLPTSEPDDVALEISSPSSGGSWLPWRS